MTITLGGGGGDGPQNGGLASIGHAVQVQTPPERA